MAISSYARKTNFGEGFGHQMKSRRRSRPVHAHSKPIVHVHCGVKQPPAVQCKLPRLDASHFSQQASCFMGDLHIFFEADLGTIYISARGFCSQLKLPRAVLNSCVLGWSRSSVLHRLFNRQTRVSRQTTEFATRPRGGNNPCGNTTLPFIASSRHEPKTQA
jgi:hypothetical protein